MPQSERCRRFLPDENEFRRGFQSSAENPDSGKTDVPEGFGFPSGRTAGRTCCQTADTVLVPGGQACLLPAFVRHGFGGFSF